MTQDEKSPTVPESVRMSISVEGSGEVWALEVPGSLKVGDLQSHLADQHNRPNIKEMAVSVEDQEAPASSDTTLSDLVQGARRGRIHLHHCRRVMVTVEYNSKTHTRAFPPSATVHRVLIWAISKAAFDLEAEAHDLELQLSGADAALQQNVHIGTLATDCQLMLQLVPKDRPQG